MNIEVVVSLGPRQVAVTQLQSELTLNVIQAQSIALAQLGHDSVDHPAWAYAVWGKRVSVNTVLQDGDRLELLRPLKVDPKEARRLRFNQQGSRAAGLFAQRRPGAKAGY